jgi:hypothetical protein
MCSGGRDAGEYLMSICGSNFLVNLFYYLLEMEKEFSSFRDFWTPIDPKLKKLASYLMEHPLLPVQV